MPLTGIAEPPTLLKPFLVPEQSSAFEQCLGNQDYLYVLLARVHFLPRLKPGGLRGDEQGSLFR